MAYEAPQLTGSEAARLLTPTADGVRGSTSAGATVDGVRGFASAGATVDGMRGATDAYDLLRPGSSLLAAGAYADKRVLFLDVDGVLNTLASCSSRRAIVSPNWPGPLSAPLLARLGKVLSATGAVVVLSSTWRLHDAGVAALMHGLRFSGIDTSICCGATPSLPGRPRAHEIAEWIDTHGPCATWAAVDDLDLWCEDPTRMNGHAVRTHACMHAYVQRE